jgi:hypothetical protein
LELESKTISPDIVNRVAQMAGAEIAAAQTQIAEGEKEKLLRLRIGN